MRRVNDAVVRKPIHMSDDCEVLRVAAFTKHGNAICAYRSPRKTVIEPSPGTWEKVGRWKWRPLRGWIFTPDRKEVG